MLKSVIFMQDLIEYIFTLFKSKLQIIDENKLLLYINFCITHDQKTHIKYETAKHHILPKAKTCFPEYADLNMFQFNKVFLTHKDHYIAHSLLAESVNNKSILYAWYAMNNKSSKLYDIKFKDLLPCDMYSYLIQQIKHENSKNSKGYVTVIKNGKVQRVTVNEHKQFNYETPSTNMVYVFNVITQQNEFVSKNEFNLNKEKYIFHTKNKCTYFNIKTHTFNRLDTDQKTEYDIGISTRCIVIRNNKKIVIKLYEMQENDIFVSKYTDNTPKFPKLRLKQMKVKQKIKKERTYIKTEKYYKRIEQQKTEVLVIDKDTKEVKIIDKKDFDRTKYDGINKNKIKVFNKELKKNVLIYKNEFDPNIHSAKINTAPSGRNDKKSINFTLYDINNNIVFECIRYEIKEKCKNINLGWKQFLNSYYSNSPIKTGIYAGYYVKGEKIWKK